MKRLYLTDAGVESWRKATPSGRFRDRLLDAVGEYEGKLDRGDFRAEGSLGVELAGLIIDELIEEGLVEER